MSIRDVIRSSFLEGYGAGEISTKKILVALLLAGCVGLYIFFCYRVLTRKTFYSKSFNISLVAVALITAAIMLVMQANVLVSLGMVGALSIVRFRTAVKDPLDLVFLFWSISVGIICGVGVSEIALILSLAVTAALFVLDKMPAAKAPMLLVVNARYGEETEKKIEASVGRHCRQYIVKSRSLSDDVLDMAIELRGASAGFQLMLAELHDIPEVCSLNLLQHDGEVTF